MATTRSLIARGERAPDFALPRDEGERPVRFYGLVGGRPAVLLFGDDRVVAEVAAKLRAAGGDPLDVHVVVRGPAPVEGAFRDSDGRVHDAYGVEGDASAVVVLDPNVRVVTSAPIHDTGSAVDAVVEAVPAPPADGGIVAPGLAPVLVVPDALAPTFRDELIERWASEGSVETGVETVVEGERAEATDVRRKRRRDHIVTDPQLLRRLTQHVGARVFPELQKAFAFAAGGFEGFKIGCYTAEDRGHFEAHRDNLSAGTAHRRFGLSLNLNDDYTGGELRFPEYGAARYRPAAGEALLFSGSHLHEVLPVEHGQRFVLLSFVLARRAS